MSILEARESSRGKVRDEWERRGIDERWLEKTQYFGKIFEPEKMILGFRRARRVAETCGERVQHNAAAPVLFYDEVASMPDLEDMWVTMVTMGHRL